MVEHSTADREVSGSNPDAPNFADHIFLYQKNFPYHLGTIRVKMYSKPKTMVFGQVCLI